MSHLEALRLAGLIESVESWRERQHADAAGTTDNLDTKRIPPGWIYFATRVAVIDRTSAATSWRVGTFDGSYLAEAEEQRSPVANTLYWWDSELPVHEGTLIRAQLAGGTAGDDLDLHVWGYKVKLKAIPTWKG